MLTKKCKYALQAMILLAREYEHGPILVAQIAGEEGIPKKFLELILLDLKNRGIVQSKKGKGGGYSLGKSPSAITLGDIIREIDGPLAPIPCVSQTAYAPCEECKEEDICGIRIVMKDVRDSIAKILDETTLADVLKRVQKAVEAKQVSMEYQI